MYEVNEIDYEQTIMLELLDRLKTEPNNAKLLFKIASTNFNSRNFGDALFYINKAIEIDNNYDYLRLKAFTLYELNEIDDSLMLINECIEQNPNDEELYDHIALINESKSEHFIIQAIKILIYHSIYLIIGFIMSLYMIKLKYEPFLHKKFDNLYTLVDGILVKKEYNLFEFTPLAIQFAVIAAYYKLVTANFNSTLSKFSICILGYYLTITISIVFEYLLNNNDSLIYTRNFTLLIIGIIVFLITKNKRLNKH